jgi:putative FmdB family regulatory protein
VPIYEYECRKCGVFDYEQSIADRPLARCPKCRSKVTKLISASAFHLKGGGWYSDGYDRKAGASPAATSGDDAPAAGGAAPSSTETAAAPTPTPPAKKKKTKPTGTSNKA